MGQAGWSESYSVDCMRLDNGHRAMYGICVEGKWRRKKEKEEERKMGKRGVG